MSASDVRTEGEATAAIVTSPRGRARNALQARVGGLPAPFWWLWVGTLVNRAGTFIEPFIILYLTGPRHLSIATAGTVVTVWGAGSIAAQPIGGYLTDRVGRRTTLGIGMFAVALAIGTLAIARGVPAIMLAALFVGIVGDIYRPAAAATVADLLDGEQRTRAFALQFWAINLGFSVAAVSAGLLVRLGFSTLFIIDAITSLVFGLVVLRKVPETRPDSAVRRDHDEPAWRLMLRDKILLAMVALFLCYATLYGQVYVTLPLAVKDAGLGTAAYGLIMAVNGVVIVVVQPLTLTLVARTPRTVLLPTTMLLVGGGIALSAVCHNVWAFALTVVVWTLGEIGQSTALFTLLASIAPEALRGRYMGAAGLAWGASGVLAPFIGSRVYAASPGTLWLGCLALSAVAAVGLFAMATRLREPPGPE
ncbi:MAG TPA: MFS transporter [Jatrophihabitantaceae bacterium]|nr:MFS transporter [Jatrophihabitantaceae bacterium]